MSEGQKSVHVVILGGGLAGLSALHTLRQGLSTAAKHIEPRITLIEASETVGGKVKTVPERNPDGSVNLWHDVGPHSFRTYGNGLTTLKLVEDLGITTELVSPSQSAKRRLIFSSGKIHEVSFAFIARLMGWRMIWSFIQSMFSCHTVSRIKNRSISLYGALRTIFGRDCADILGQSMARGIFAGDAHDLALSEAFPGAFSELAKYVQSPFCYIFRKLMGTMSNIKELFLLKCGLREPPQVNASPHDALSLALQASIYSFRKGMYQLPEAIYKAAQKDKTVQFIHKTARFIRKNSEIHSDASKPKYSIALDDMDIIHADYIISAVPSNALLEILLQSRASSSPNEEKVPVCSSEVEQLLAMIRHRSVHVVNFSINEPFKGHHAFGYLTHHRNDPILGVIYDSAAFPSKYPEGITVCTAMVRPLYSLTDSQREAAEPLVEGDATSFYAECGKVAIERALMNSSYLQSDVSRNGSWHHYDWPDAIPQYTPGHSDRVKRIRAVLEAQCPEMTLCGSSYDGISVNDAIHSGMLQGQKLLSILTGSCLRS